MVDSQTVLPEFECGHSFSDLPNIHEDMDEKLLTHEEYRRLRERFFASKGVQQYNAFLSNRLAHYTFETNYHDIKDLIQSHFTRRVNGQLGDWNNKEPLHTFLMEVTRLLHNYLAAAKSLVDNTRYFVKNTFGESSTPHREYESEVKRRFGNSPVSKFTLDLRRNMTHVCMPFISSVMGGSKATGRDLFTIKLNIQKIVPSWSWCAGARHYIDAQNGEIDLELYVIEYRGLVIQFSEWLSSQVPVWGNDEWNETMALQDKLIRYEENLDQQFGSNKAE